MTIENILQEAVFAYLERRDPRMSVVPVHGTENPQVVWRRMMTTWKWEQLKKRVDHEKAVLRSSLPVGDIVRAHIRGLDREREEMRKQINLEKRR